MENSNANNASTSVKKVRRKRKKDVNRPPIKKDVARPPVAPETIEAWWVPESNKVKVSEVKEEAVNIMVKFMTKQEQYSISAVPISIKSDFGLEKLNDIVSQFLDKAGVVEDIPEFEFLLGGKLIVGTVGDHLNTLGINYEITSTIEFFERSSPPTPKDYLEHDDWVSSVRLSDEWLLTGCYDNTVHLWSVPSMEKGLCKKAHKLSIPAHKAPVKAVTWLETTDPEKKMFVSCSIDQRAMVWQWEPSQNDAVCLIECRGHSQSIECVAASNQMTFATGSWDNTVKIWNADPHDENDHVDDEPDPKKVRRQKGALKLKSPLMTLAGHGECVSALTWVDNEQLLSCSWDHTIRLWDVEIGGMTSQITGNVSFFCLSYSPLNKTLLAGCADRHIRLYDHRIKEGSVVLNKYVSHSKWVPSVCWSPINENQFVSGSFDNSVKVWDRRSSQSSVYDLQGHSDKVMSVDWSSQRFIASGSTDCTAQIYDT